MKYFRLIQEGFGASRWLPSDFATDLELARRGLMLGGTGRVAPDEIADRIAHLLRPGHYLDDNETEELEKLLSQAPYTIYVPPIDIDIQDQVSGFSSEGARALALEYARRLDTELPRRGLGRPSWYVTNQHGGLHGDLIAPAHLASPYLLLGYYDLVTQIGRDLGIPLQTDQPYEKKDRVLPVHLDNSIFRRYPDARGCVWRLVGSRKPGKMPKTPFDIWNACVIPHAYPNEPANFDPVSEACQRAETRVADEETRIRQACTKFSETPQDPGARLAYMDDVAFVRSVPALLEVWNNWATADRSKRLWSALAAAARAGADDARLARLAWTLPGPNKVLERKDGARYVDRTVLSVRRIVGYHRPQVVAITAPPPIASSGPIALASSTQEWVIRHGNTLDENARDALLRALSGSLVRHGLPESDIASAITPIEKSPLGPNEIGARDAALKRIHKTRERILAKKSVLGSGWLRRNLGYTACLELVRGLSDDHQQDPVALTKSVMGGGTLRGPDVEFLRAVTDRLEFGDKIRNPLIAPTGCMQWHDAVRGLQTGKVYMKIMKTCGKVNCPSCWLNRVGWERDLLSGEGWKKRGPRFWIFAAENLPDVAAVDTIRKRLTLCRVPKLVSVGFKNGKYSVLAFTDDPWAASRLPAPLEHYAKIAGGSFREVVTTDYTVAVQELLMTRLELHVHERELMRTESRDAYVAWVRWRHGKHLVSRSRKALPFPSREEIRAAASDSKDGVRLDDIEEPIAYDATHTATEVVVDSDSGRLARDGTPIPPRPHTINECIEMGKGKLLEINAALARKMAEAEYADAEELAQIRADTALREELARERALT